MAHRWNRVHPPFEPQDPDFEARVRASFARQRMMDTIGARLANVSPGAVGIEWPFRDELTQQHGFVHAGIVATLADNACGYAALSLAPAGTAVLTIEYKVNLLSPAAGRRLIARGSVVRPGRTITVCTADVFSSGDDNDEALIASMLSTIAVRRGADGLRD